MSLVTLDQAKAHLRITSTADDPDLTEKLTQAEAAILDYIGSTDHWRTITATWTVDTVPPVVVACILLQIGELFRFRGDELPNPRVGSENLSAQIQGLLRPWRDPVFA